MRRFASLFIAGTLFVAACGPAAAPAPTAAPPAAANPTTAPAAAPTTAAAPTAAAKPTTAPAAPAPTTAPTTAAAAAPANLTRGQGGTLKLLWWQAPTILNPHLAQGTKDYDAARLVLEPLASVGPDGKPVANLAGEIPTVENGGVSKDLKTITWKLKSGVKWSDGTDFTADDVVFNYTYQSDKDTAATDVASVTGIDSVVAKDPTTVVITWKQPNPYPYQAFTGALGLIIQKKQFAEFMGSKAKDAPGNLKPIGTGPYMVTDFKPGDVVSYQANPNYRDVNKPFFKEVQMKGGGDATSAARGVFQTGEFDYAWNMQIEASVLNQMMQQGGKGEMVTSDSPNVERLLMNFANPSADLGDNRGEPTTNHPFLSDLNVRKALAMAVDRDSVGNQLYGAGLTGVPTCNILTAPPEVVSPNTKTMDVCQRDIAKANQLLDQAGWTKGADGIRQKDGVRMHIVYQTTVNTVRQKTQDIVKASWEQLGVEVELKTVDAGVFFSSDAGNPDTAGHFFTDVEMFTNGSSQPEPTDWFHDWTTEAIAAKGNEWRGNNYERWSNPDFDKIWNQLKTESDTAKRDQLAIQLNDLLVSQVVVIPLVARKFPVAAKSKQLQGVVPDPWDGDLWNIADWSKSGG